MEPRKIIFIFLCIVMIDAILMENENNGEVGEVKSEPNSNLNEVETENNPGSAFNGVYTECFLYWSYSCLQRKTLLYLRHLDNMSDISVLGDYVKFVKLNNTVEEISPDEEATAENSEELSLMIDKAVDKFFDNHVLKFSALGKNVTVPHTVEGFVGRKKRKGGGGGGGGHDDGGKKKMMMMAMMCMKMKFMMMVPAMMGMMGMMSFKGMMFSMMSFMISKMMLLMKLLEKKGGAGSGGVGDGSWAAGAGGGGAWMPAGGQDYGGGGYDANGQWQSRSILEHLDKIESEEILNNKPVISYVTPIVRYNNNLPKKPFSVIKNLNDEVIKANQEKKAKSRKKRGIVDMLQNAYLYWLSKVLGTNNKKINPFPNYRIINGVKYVYYPIRQFQRPKSPKAIANNNIKNVEEGFKPIITAEDFNKGEIVEGPEIPAESRMSRRKFHKMKETVNDTVDDNPWE